MAKLSALGAAARKTSAGTKKPTSPLIVAGEIRDLANPDKILFTRDEVIASIKGYAHGDALAKQADALKKLHRPTVMAQGLHGYVKLWNEGGVPLDHNPVIMEKADGTGLRMLYTVSDKEVNMNESQFAALANLIGATEAEKNSIRREEIEFNQDALERSVEGQLDEDGGTKTVLNLIDEAVTEKLTSIGREDLLNGLFVIKPVFTTRKNLVKKGLTLVGNNLQKLAQFVNASLAPQGLRPGGADDDE